MVTFKLVPHPARSGMKIVEIWDEGEFMGAIWPAERGVKIRSKYIDVEDPRVFVDSSHPPEISIEFGT